MLNSKKVRIFYIRTGKEQGFHSHVVTESRVQIQLSVSISRSVVPDCLWPPWTAAYQAPLSMRFFRQAYWSGLPFPSSDKYSCSPSKSIKEARLAERKVCFVRNAGNKLGDARQTLVQRPTHPAPHPTDNQWARASIYERKGLMLRRHGQL